MRAEGEIEITEEIEEEILSASRSLGLPADQLRYYVQFGPSAPRPPIPWNEPDTGRLRAWWRRLMR